MIERATREHMIELAGNLRAMDIAEAIAFTGRSAGDLLLESLEISMETYAWIVDGRVACVWGLGAENLVAGPGVPWLATSPIVERHRITFLRGSRMIVERMLDSYPVIENWVDARHAVCLRWLLWLGFRIYAPRPIGVNGEMFHRFEKRRD